MDSIMHARDSGSVLARRRCPCGLAAIAPVDPHLGRGLCINDLPDEMLAAIFRYLSCFETTASVPLVCRRWARIEGDGCVVPYRACHPYARLFPERLLRRTLAPACGPKCPLDGIDETHGVVYARMPSIYRTDPPRSSVFAAIGLFCPPSRSRFVARYRPSDARPCELSARYQGDAAAIGLIDCQWPSSPRVFALCVLGGSTVERLIDLVLAGCPIDGSVVAMASAWIGREDVLSLIVRLGAQHTIDTRAWQVAAARGQVGWMASAKSHGLSMPAQQCARAAALGGHLDVVTWLQHECDRADPLIVTGAAASGATVGDLEILVADGWAVTYDSLWEPIRRGDLALVAWLQATLDMIPGALPKEQRARCCVEAARHGQLDCLVYLVGHGCPWSAGVCAAAAAGGHLDCLSYARQSGCPWDIETCRAAAARGHLDCLIYAHDNECPWDASVCQAASRGGHVGCLAYAHQGGCPWDHMTILGAAEGGHLDCMAYAHERGCPWHDMTMATALSSGHRNCVI